MSKNFLRKTAAFAAIVISCFVVLCSCSGSGNVGEGDDLPVLKIGVDYYEPFIYRDDDGEFAGIDAELAAEVCKNIGYKPEFIHIDWSKKNALLADGSIDCVWCCFSVTGREDEYAWSLPYMNSRQVVAVKNDSDITKLIDLENKRVAVQSTTKADEIFSGRSGVKNVIIPQIKELNCLPNVNYLLAAINEGYVDAIAGHEIVLREYMKTSTAQLRILEECLLEVRVGVAFLSGTHAETVARINDTFKILKNNGYLAKLMTSHGLDPDVYVVNYEEV